MKKGLTKIIVGALLTALAVGCGKSHSSHDFGTFHPSLAPPHGSKHLVLADVSREIDAYPTPKSVDAAQWAMLRSDLKRMLSARSADGKTISVAPAGGANVLKDLKATLNGSAATLTWTERNVGDYDLDGEVGVSDLAAIAEHYGESVTYDSNGMPTPGLLNEQRAVIDGNGDGQIDVSDLGPLAENYGATLTGYNVYRGTTALGGSPTVARGAPVGGCAPKYQYVDPASGPNVTYCVRPVANDGTEGASTGVNTSGMREWTVMFYLAGDQGTYSANLGPQMYTELNALEAGLTPNPSVAVVAEAKLRQAGSPPQNMAFRYLMRHDSDTNSLNFGVGSYYQDLGFSSFDSSAPASITSFIQWAAANFPANHYCLILKDHGGSWQPGAKIKSSIIEDDSFRTILYNSDAAQAIASSGVRIDVLNLDACLMGTAEVADEFKGVCDYLVFSENVNYGYTWVGILSLFSQPGMAPRSLAQASVDAYHDLWLNPPPAVGTVNEAMTLSAVDTSAVPALTSSIGALRDVLVGSMATERANLVTAASAGRQMGMIDGYIGQVDLHSFIETYNGATSSSAIQSALSAVDDSLSSAVVAHAHVDGRWESIPAEGGLVLFMPSFKNYFNLVDESTYGSYYRNDLSFNQETHWYDVLCQMWSASIAGGPWPKFRGNQSNTGQSPYVGSQTNAVKWTTQTGGRVESSAAIGLDGIVYVGSDDCLLYALNPADGGVKWTYKTRGAVRSTPVVGTDGNVYVGSGDCVVYALSASDGKVRWTRATSGSVVSSPTIGLDGTILVGSDNGKVYALNEVTGGVKWASETGGWVRGSPAIAQDGTVIAGGGKSVCALDPYDGALKWTYETAGQVCGSPAIAVDGTVVACGGNRIYALSGSDGSLKWSYATGYSIGNSPAIGSDGTVYVGGGDYRLYALDLSTGSLKWSCNTRSGVYNSPAIGADGTIYVGGQDGSVSAYDSFNGGLKWTYQTGSFVDSSPTIGSDGTVYVGSDDGKLYAFGGSGGTWVVSGSVTVGGSPLSGMMMKLLPGNLMAWTRADGTYAFVNVPNGTFTVAPVSNDYSFNPGSLQVTVADSNANGFDFAVAICSVSGRITLGGTGFAGVMVTITPGGLKAYTGTDGTYTISGLSKGNFTVAPTEDVHWFTPATRTISLSGAPVTGQDFLAASGGLADASWSKFHQGSLNAGQSPYVGPQTGSLKWTRATGAPVQGSPAIGADGTVYVFNSNGKVCALSSADGGVKWTSMTGSTGSGAPAIAVDGTVYVGTSIGVYALSPLDGSVRWRSSVGGSVLGSPTVGEDGSVFVGGSMFGMYALNPADGSLKWSHTVGTVWATPAIAQSGAVIVGLGDGLHAFDPHDGSVQWLCNMGGALESSPAVASNSTVFVGCDDWGLHAVDLGSGYAKWTYLTECPVRSSPAVGADGMVYVGCDDGRIYALSASNGDSKWILKTGAAVSSSPAVSADGTVYVGCWNGKVYALDPSTGAVKWSYTTAGPVESSPAIGADGRLYVGSDDGNVYAFGS